jgi:putative inorganic carbon (hco3(-)) transporter
MSPQAKRQGATVVVPVPEMPVAATRVGSIVVRAVGALGIASGGIAAGLALGWIGDRFGPALMLALPLGGVVTAAILARPLVGVLAVYASFPVGFLPLPTDVIGVQAAELAVVLVIGAVTIRRLASGLLPPWSPPMWWAVLLLVWALVATPSAVDLPSALKQDAQLAGGVLFALTILAACRDLKDVRTALTGLLIVASGMAAYGLREISSIRSQFGGAVVTGRAQGVFPQPNDLGAFAAIVFMVALGSALGSRGRGVRVLSIAAAGLSILALLMSLSRGAWVGTALGGALMLYLLPQARRALLAMVLPVLVGLGLVIAVVNAPDPPQVRIVRERLATFADPTKNPYDNRIAIYREAWREIRADPWTGVGPGGFPSASARAGSLTGVLGAAHAHSVLLTVATEMGLPASVLVIGLTVAIGLVVLRAMRQLPSARDRAIVAGIGSGLFVQVGQGLVDFNLRNPVIFILMWSLVGMVLVTRRELERLRAPEEAG